MFTTKKIFDEVGLFDYSLKSGGDLEWGERVYKENKSAFFSDKALNFHHARQTINELITKTRRVIAGLKYIEYKGEDKKPTFLTMLLIPPFTRMRNVITNKTLGSIRVRLYLASLVYFFKLVGAFELLRLALGYDEERK